MARKTLLNESEIRRFLKLADVGVVGDQRLEELSSKEQNEGLMSTVGDVLGQRDEEEGDLGAELDAEEEPPADLPAEDDVEVDVGDEGAGQMVSVDDFMSALESALEDVMGEPTSVEMSDDEEVLDEPEPEVGGGEDIEMDLGPEDEEALQEDKKANVGHGPGKEVKDGNGKPTGRWLKEEEEDSLEESDELDEDAVVQEVARRVAARLVSEKKKEDLAEQLATRILNRLTK